MICSDIQKNIPLLRGGYVFLSRGGVHPLPVTAMPWHPPPSGKRGEAGDVLPHRNTPSREGDAFFSFFGRSVGPLGACRNSNFLRITKITILVFAPNLRVKRFLSDETNKRTSALRRKRRFPHGNLFCGKGHPFRHSHCSCHPPLKGWAGVSKTNFVNYFRGFLIFACADVLHLGAINHFDKNYHLSRPFR